MDLSIIKRLAAHPDWNHFEEIRTVFGSQQDLTSEDSIRKAANLPPRGVCGIPGSMRYTLNSMIKKRYGDVDVPRKYSVSLFSERMAESEAEYVPLYVRLLSCRDDVILKFAGKRATPTYQNTMKLIRYTLDVQSFDSNMEVITPIRSNTEVGNSEKRPTPIPSSDNDDGDSYVMPIDKKITIPQQQTEGNNTSDKS